jgi:hypothetical protein
MESKRCLASFARIQTEWRLPSSCRHNGPRENELWNALLRQPRPSTPSGKALLAELTKAEHERLRDFGRKRQQYLSDIASIFEQ